MKRIIIPWILGILIFCGSLTAYATENSISEIKPTIAILYIDDNAKNIKLSTQKATEAKVLDGIVEKFSPKYNIFIDDKKIDEIKAAGIQDILTVERGDIMSFYKDDNIDFIVLINLFPPEHIEPSYGFTIKTSLQLKIIDFKNNKYLYNGKPTFTSHWAGMDGHYKELNKQIVTQLVKTFPIE